MKHAPWGDEHYRGLLERLPAAAYTCDAAGLITYFNPRAVEVWGRAPTLNDPVDRFCGSFRLFLPDGSPLRHDRCWMALALRHERAYEGEEILIERPDGSRVVALAHANPIYGADGELIGAVNVLVDITDQKRAETALREADRRKDDFLATLGHELRNPLAALHQGVELLRSAADPEVRGRAVDVLERQVLHATRLVNDLLEVSRITRGDLELRRQPFVLSELVRNAVEISAPSIEAGRHDLTVDVSDGSARVDADPVRLAQVLANLLDNASQHMRPGGRIWLEAEVVGGEAVFRVRDDGPGIRPERLSSMFEPFTRGGPERVSGRNGLGVGLAVVRSLVRLHGGRVEAESEGDGTGLQVTVWIPLADRVEGEAGPAAADDDGRPEPAAAPAPGFAGIDGAARRRVLVVDDNRDAARSLGTLLRLSGFRARVAHDGAAALRAVAEERPDVVLLDLGMPEMDGLEVARRIRGGGNGPEPTLVALTGWGEASVRERCREVGFDHHLVKPVGMDVLRALFESLDRQPA